MSDADDDLAALQRELRDRLERLDRLPASTPAGGRDHADDDPDRAAAVADVLAATERLVDHEERLPRLREQARWAAGVQSVRWSGRAVIAVAGVLALAGLAGWVSRWWLLLAVPMAAAGAVAQLVPIPPDAGPERRIGGLVMFAAAGASPLLVFGVLPFWLAPVALLALGLGAFLVNGGHGSGPGMGELRRRRFGAGR